MESKLGGKQFQIVKNKVKRPERWVRLNNGYAKQMNTKHAHIFEKQAFSTTFVNVMYSFEKTGFRTDIFWSLYRY